FRKGLENAVRLPTGSRGRPPERTYLHRACAPLSEEVSPIDHMILWGDPPLRAAGAQRGRHLPAPSLGHPALSRDSCHQRARWDSRPAPDADPGELVAMDWAI